MKRRVVLLAALASALPVVAQDRAATIGDLLERVRSQSQFRAAENAAREQRFMEAREQQQLLLDEVASELAAERARSEALKASFDGNENDLAELAETLRLRVGDMGELFGVVRQVAGDAKGIVETSLISAQYPGRAERADALAQARGLPSIADLRDLQLLLLEEMAETGNVVRYRGDVVTADGMTAQREVVRVGAFNVISGSDYLTFEPQTGTLQVLVRQPAARFGALAGGLSAATDGYVPMAIDPSRGSLLNLLIQSPTLLERIRQGGVVGYVIIILGVLGVVVAGERLVRLSAASRGIRAQLKASTASSDNALGRILLAYDDLVVTDSEALSLKLDEAILREAPALERGQGWIKVLAAVAPLLGLLGTVVGMIRTFQAITLFGTGDPQLMAGGISQALVTTVLGLTVAIPLVLLHSVVAGRSRALVEILEEQSAGIVARHSDRVHPRD